MLPPIKKPTTYFLLLCILALTGVVAVWLSEAFLLREKGLQPAAAAANEAMARGLAAVAAQRAVLGVPLNEADDVNRTGFIGWKYSDMTTTVGDVQAKRTTTNPEMAALIAGFLLEAHVAEGDAVAIGASGSFPALVLATVCAAEAVGAEPLLIYSFGASQWGANDQRFTWLEMEDGLVAAGVISHRALAVSLGGDRDAALDLPERVREALTAKAETRRIPLIGGGVLEANVADRLALYREWAKGRRIAAFVNVGGTWADLGTSAAALDLKPGLQWVKGLPELEKRGVLHAMAAEGLPVIHLLNIRELASRHSLPWDPSPLPALEPKMRTGITAAWLACAAAYLTVVTASLAIGRTSKAGRTRRSGGAG